MLNKNNVKPRLELGFTLIEVLIALAILAIALTAIIKVTAQNIRDTTYIQNKTIAAWIGTEIINEIRAGITNIPDHLEKNIVILNQPWSWEANSLPTPNKHIQEIQVRVFKQPNHQHLINLTSYIYAN